jgi:iron complex outermembrane receptor protein
MQVKNKNAKKAVKLTTLLTSVLTVSSALALEMPNENEELAKTAVEVISLGDIEEIGAFGAVDIVNFLSINAGAQNDNDGFNQTFSLSTTNIDLRSLRVSSTLTLLNGLRQVATAATTLNSDQFTDLNSLLATIAISRVEILKDGASLPYGSDAIAGVTNFAPKMDFIGLEFNVDHKTTSSDSQDDSQLSVLYGHESDESNLIIATSYFDRSPLSGAARSDEFELRDANSTFGKPGTFLVFQPTGTPQFTPDPSYRQVPATNPGPATGRVDPSFCGFDFGDHFSMVAEKERSHVYAAINSQIEKNTAFLAEFCYSNNDVVITTSSSQPVLFTLLIPPTNPSATAAGNTQGALFFGRQAGTGSDAGRIYIGPENWRTVLGFKREFNDVWNWQAAAGHNEKIYTYSDSSDILVDRFQAALAGDFNNYIEQWSK